MNKREIASLHNFVPATSPMKFNKWESLKHAEGTKIAAKFPNTCNVCEESTAVDLNGKTIALLQRNMSPRSNNLKLQANEINFENCSA